MGTAPPPAAAKVPVAAKLSTAPPPAAAAAPAPAEKEELRAKAPPAAKQPAPAAAAAAVTRPSLGELTNRMKVLRDRVNHKQPAAASTTTVKPTAGPAFMAIKAKTAAAAAVGGAGAGAGAAPPASLDNIRARLARLRAGN